MHPDFSWIPFYQAFARKLLDYKKRDDRKKLIHSISELAQKQNLLRYLTKDQNPPNTQITLDDICPFTLMGSFNRGRLTPNNRKIIARQLGEIIGLDPDQNKPPESFDGIPVLLPMNAMFFSYAYARQPEDINTLWRVFEAAINLADNHNDAQCRENFIAMYNSAINVKRTSWNLSQGLFWISPRFYLTLDGQSRNYIQNGLGIRILNAGMHAPCNADRYLELMQIFNERFQQGIDGINDFPNLSYMAWIFGASPSESMHQQLVNIAISADEVPSEEIPASKEYFLCKNVIYYGPPGTGKTLTVLNLLREAYGMPTQGFAITQDARYTFVTFHQSYGYEEFVEGLRPVLGSQVQVGSIQYEIRDGVFKILCEKARKSPHQRFAIVIDEINRGNINKIFGELITLIEPDKREGQENFISVTLPYSLKSFSIPSNVDIFGTMNTADRSLALLDTALRRRFDFVPVLPDTRTEEDPNDPLSAPLAGLIVTKAGVTIDIRLMLEKINLRIEALYDRDHCIGHAYFKRLRDKDGDESQFEILSEIFRNSIAPLLEEYFFEDWQKIRLVLGDNQKPPLAQFIKEINEQEQDFNTLFGNNHGLDSYANKPRYQLQASAFTNPDAYRGIYEHLN